MELFPLPVRFVRSVFWSGLETQVFNLTCGYLLVPTRANLGQAIFRVRMDPPSWFPLGSGETEEMRKRRWNEYQQNRAAEEESKKHAQAAAEEAQRQEDQARVSQERWAASQGSAMTPGGLTVEQIQISLMAAARADQVEKSVGPPQRNLRGTSRRLWARP